MSVENLLSRLEKVKRTGQGTWIARCPAHQDDTPSLSVRDTGDGHVLVHCFAQCSLEAIVGAVGIEIDELFPERPPLGGAPARRSYRPSDVLECVAQEAAMVVVIAHDMHAHRTVSDKDYERLLLAAERIEEARRLALG